jgi:hypothetical protein
MLIRVFPKPAGPEPKQGGNWKQETENGKPETVNPNTRLRRQCRGTAG